ncbi:hypothetical protein GQ457_04G015390 [Hibiscus cannabinus]
MRYVILLVRRSLFTVRIHRRSLQPPAHATSEMGSGGGNRSRPVVGVLDERDGDDLGTGWYRVGAEVEARSLNGGRSLVQELEGAGWKLDEGIKKCWPCSLQCHKDAAGPRISHPRVLAVCTVARDHGSWHIRFKQGTMGAPAAGCWLGSPRDHGCIS